MWKYVDYFQIFLYWFLTYSTVIREQNLHDFRNLDPEIFANCFMSLDMFQVCWFIVYGNLNRICILLLYEIFMNINYVELTCNAFQIYYILLFFCLFILLIFESLILKLQLEIFIFFKKIIAIYSETVCNLVWYFPSLL